MAEEWAGARAPLVRGVRAAAPRRRAGPRRDVPDLPDARRAPGRSSPSAWRPTSRRRCARPSGRPAGSSPTSSGRSGVQGVLLAPCYDHRPFLRGLRAVRRARSRWRASGRRSASSLLKLTVPGVPDIYQGDELLDLSLVDPDNRRPVDWERRRCAAGRAARRRAGAAGDLKLAADRARCSRCGRAGRRRSRGAYEPLEAGPCACAFVRGGDVLVCVAVRDGWREGDARRPAGPALARRAGRRRRAPRAHGRRAARRPARRARRRRARARRLTRLERRTLRPPARRCR